jgi:Arc/MetJ-type ribon-helix-helix transcriptional regulator
MASSTSTPAAVEEIIAQWIAEGRFANRNEAVRAGILALKEKLERHSVDPEFSRIVRQLDNHPGGSGEPSAEDFRKIARIARSHRRK